MILRKTSIFKAAFTEKLEIFDADKTPAFPIYRVTDAAGNIIDHSHDPKFDKVGDRFFLEIIYIFHVL